MTYLEELKEKRRSSLIVVCTFGLAALFMESVQPVWKTNLFEGMLFAQGPLASFFKLFSYFALGVIAAAVFFVIHFIKVIDYTIEISRHP